MAKALAKPSGDDPKIGDWKIAVSPCKRSPKTPLPGCIGAGPLVCKTAVSRLTETPFHVRGPCTLMLGTGSLKSVVFLVVPSFSVLVYWSALSLWCIVEVVEYLDEFADE
jgi:hypothetical protein